MLNNLHPSLYDGMTVRSEIARPPLEKQIGEQSNTVVALTEMTAIVYVKIEFKPKQQLNRSMSLSISLSLFFEVCKPSILFSFKNNF